ncbi:hypothetical protein [Roseobacter weihaiensis]|uniref:hypothetical protein n=1 Tax=Roseobacter weihaiensis TaxID=2763262 RepID=UPI001D0A9B02|nr:hypothetical protein [Roseobacter sp. H9]
MTTPVDPLEDFDDLRRVAIDYAQQASGEIWTDYNLHDPGVTLLEQTCFALSQIAYQVGLPARDLLTNRRGHFCTHDLALFHPRKVLGTDPVTRDDLAAWLCACPEVDSVTIAAPQTSRRGLFDVTIVPAEGVPPEAVPEAFRQAFATARPLGTGLGELHLARPVNVALVGQVEITSEALPETVAAHLYHRMSQLLTGADRQQKAATRANVWEAPERLLPSTKGRTQGTLDLSCHLSRLRDVPGLRDLGSITLKPLVPLPKNRSNQIYFHVVLPRTTDQILLELTLNGAPVTLSPSRLREEVTRISAQDIAAATHNIDRLDWDVMRPGRRRSFTHAHVDALLPGLFRAGDYRMQHPESPIAEYRGAIDRVLHEMVSDLSALPRTFAADPVGETLTDDPVVHRTRVQLLDYLIALQGAEMPATRHSGLHCYRTTRARHRFDVSWRLEYLFALPTLHRSRGTGPGPETPGGFLAELALLCDLDLSEDGRITQPLQAYGLRLDSAGTDPDPAAQEDVLLVDATNPFDMLVPEDEAAEVLTPQALAELSPFIEDGALDPAVFARLAEADSLVVAPSPGGWQILFDPGGDAALRRLTATGSKQDALQRVGALRATWRHLNRHCEAAHLVEHVLLRDDAGGGDPDVADLLLPGWTTRCRMQSYRSYVEAQVGALAPAHLHIRVLWLDFDQMRAFEARKENASGDTAGLRRMLNDLAEGSS